MAGRNGEAYGNRRFLMPVSCHEFFIAADEAIEQNHGRRCGAFLRRIGAAMRSVCLFVAGLLVAGATAACGSSTPVAATPTITETFNGTIQAQGSDTHTFNVTSYGEVDITLTAAGPPPTITIGLAIGAVTSGACSVGSIAQGSTQAQTTPQWVNNLSIGAYCVTVFDAGNVGTTPISYTVTVLHP